MKFFPLSRAAVAAVVLVVVAHLGFVAPRTISEFSRLRESDSERFNPELTQEISSVRSLSEFKYKASAKYKERPPKKRKYLGQQAKLKNIVKSHFAFDHSQFVNPFNYPKHEDDEEDNDFIQQGPSLKKDRDVFANITGCQSDMVDLASHSLNWLNRERIQQSFHYYFDFGSMPLCDALPDSSYFMMHQDLRGVMYHQAFGICLPKSCQDDPTFLNDLLANFSEVANEFVDNLVKPVHSFDNLTDFIPPNSSYATPAYMLTNLIRDRSHMTFRAEAVQPELDGFRASTETLRSVCSYFIGGVLLFLVFIPNSTIICARCRPKKKALSQAQPSNFTIQDQTILDEESDGDEPEELQSPSSDTGGLQKQLLEAPDEKDSSDESLGFDRIEELNNKIVSAISNTTEAFLARFSTAIEKVERYKTGPLMRQATTRKVGLIPKDLEHFVGVGCIVLLLGLPICITQEFKFSQMKNITGALSILSEWLFSQFSSSFFFIDSLFTLDAFFAGLRVSRAEDTPWKLIMSRFKTLALPYYSMWILGYAYLPMAGGPFWAFSLRKKYEECSNHLTVMRDVLMMGNLLETRQMYQSRLSCFPEGWPIQMSFHLFIAAVGIAWVKKRLPKIILLVIGAAALVVNALMLYSFASDHELTVELFSLGTFQYSYYFFTRPWLKVYALLLGYWAADLYLEQRKAFKLIQKYCLPIAGICWFNMATLMNLPYETGAQDSPFVLSMEVQALYFAIGMPLFQLSFALFLLASIGIMKRASMLQAFLAHGFWKYMASFLLVAVVVQVWVFKILLESDLWPDGIYVGDQEALTTIGAILIVLFCSFLFWGFFLLPLGKLIG